MGSNRFSRAVYSATVETHVPKGGSATGRAEQKARETGTLNPLVDPSGYGVIRRSLLRLNQREDGLWEVTVGTPVPIETRVDTTGSMGNNVDVALRVLPEAYELCSGVLPGCDVHMATGVFGDVRDRFVLCRPQFEMLAEKIVEQLTLMVPERNGGDFPEDPHYGLFGAAYLTAFYINRIGLKSYDFTVSDAPARDRLDEKTLRRVFGEEVFKKVAEAGHQINQSDLPSTKDVVRDLLDRAHAFFLQVGDEQQTSTFWSHVFGKNRVILLPSTELLPQVQATIIGLTEGTLALSDVESFLVKNNVPKGDAKKILRSVANIPLGAQAALPNFDRRPNVGDLFREKMDLWPIDPSEVPQEDAPAKGRGKKKVDWL